MILFSIINEFLMKIARSSITYVVFALVFVARILYEVLVDKYNSTQTIFIAAGVVVVCMLLIVFEIKFNKNIRKK